MLLDQVNEFGEIVINNITIKCLGPFGIKSTSLSENHIRVPKEKKVNPLVTWLLPACLLDTGM